MIITCDNADWLFTMEYDYLSCSHIPTLTRLDSIENTGVTRPLSSVKNTERPQSGEFTQDNGDKPG